MKTKYDFSKLKGKRNPYAAKLKKLVTIRNSYAAKLKKPVK